MINCYKGKFMSEISFKASITNLKSDYLKTMFESKTAAAAKHSVIYQKAGEFMEDTFSLFKNGVQTAVHKTEFYDVDSKKSLDKLLSIFEILKIKEAENLINKLRQKTQKRTI